MDGEHACALAARLHLGEVEEDGTPLLAHIQRVAAMVPVEARAVAWLHEALDIARSAGQSGSLARIVRVADLRDRCAHPRVRASGWSPPYSQALQRLTVATGGHAGV